MNKPMALIFSVLLLCLSCITVFADTTEQKGASITTTVPSTCELSFGSEEGAITENGIAVRGHEIYERKSIHTFKIVPNEEKAIDKVFFGGADVTDQIKDGYFTTPPLTADMDFKVTYKDAAKTEVTSSVTSSETVSPAASSETASSTTSSRNASSTTSSKNASSAASSKGGSPAASVNNTALTASPNNTSSNADNTFPKTGDRGGADTGAVTTVSVFAVAVISVFIVMLTASKKKKREED